MKKVCQLVGLNISSIKEIETGIIKEIAGSPEIKGVRGIDKRKYIIDLMRVHPRDANYSDKIDFSSCVVREELLKNYNFKAIHQDTPIKELMLLKHND
jgi:hypothetical protein